MKLRICQHGRGRSSIIYYRDILEINGVELVDGIDFDYAIASGNGIAKIFNDFKRAGKEIDKTKIFAIANEPSFFGPFFTTEQREGKWCEGINWWYEPRYFDPRVTSKKRPMSFFKESSHDKDKKCSMVLTHGSAFKGVMNDELRKKLNESSLLYERRTILAYKTIETSLPIDIYGRGWKPNQIWMYNPKIKGPVDEKSDGLLPYEYSIVVENCVDPLYVSEKFSDCLMCGTVPIYYGTRDVYDIYPFDCFEFLDIDSPTIINDLDKILQHSPTEEKLEQLRLAADHYHKNYSIQAVVNRLIREKV